MRYKTLVLVIIAVAASTAMIGRLGVTTSPMTMTDANQEQHQTVSVTEVDVASPRDLLDYLVSQMAQFDAQQLQLQFSHYLEDNTLLDEHLFEQFKQYHQSVTALSFSPLNRMSADWQRLHDKLLQRQQQHFSEQQQVFFEQENLIRQLAIDKQALFENYPPEKAQRLWDEQLLLQPDHIQRHEKNHRLLSAVLAIDEQQDQQDRYLALKELVDDKTIARLNQLEQTRKQFDQQWQQFVVEREAIMQSLAEHPEQQTKQINALREQLFAPQDLRRVQSLERMHLQPN